jgi:hypothetical protein
MANRKSNAAIKVKNNMLDQAASLLGELPERPEATLSLRKAIEILQEDLRDSLDKGYSYEELTEVLSNQGIDISPSTLKRYLAMSQSKEDADKPRRTRRRSTTSAKGDETNGPIAS